MILPGWASAVVGPRSIWWRCLCFQGVSTPPSPSWDASGPSGPIGMVSFFCLFWELAVSKMLPIFSTNTTIGEVWLIFHWLEQKVVAMQCIKQTHIWSMISLIRQYMRGWNCWQITMGEGLDIVGLLDTSAGSKDTILLAAFRPGVTLLRASLLTCKSSPLSVKLYRTYITYLYHCC